MFASFFHILTRRRVALSLIQFLTVYAYTCTICNRQCKARQNRGQKYCSRACLGMGLRNGEIIQCAQCGKDVYRAPCWKNRKLYCSRECQALGMRSRITRICKKCKREYVTVPSANKVYCNVNCHKRLGERQKNVRGYIEIRTKAGRAYEHRLVVEKHLGRKLLPTEQVHHKNWNKEDNRIENLQVVDIQTHATIEMNRRWAMQKRKEKVWNELIARGIVVEKNGKYHIKEQQAA